MNREEAKAKIAKLMALGTHAATNENEAERALRQAAAMMAAHAIEEAELADAQGAAHVFKWSSATICQNPAGKTKTSIGWLSTLAVHIAKFTDCKASLVRNAEWGMCIKFDGELVDVEYASYIFKHLRDTIRRLSASYRGDGTRSARENYRVGMSDRLGERMREYKAAMRNPAEASLSAGTALALIDRKIAERNAYFGAPSYRKSRGVHGGNGYSAGGSAANGVGFGRPVSGAAGMRALTGG